LFRPESPEGPEPTFPGIFSSRSPNEGTNNENHTAPLRCGAILNLLAFLANFPLSLAVKGFGKIG